jgi:hypothetical protein
MHIGSIDLLSEQGERVTAILDEDLDSVQFFVSRQTDRLDGGRRRLSTIARELKGGLGPIGLVGGALLPWGEHQRLFAFAASLAAARRAIPTRLRPSSLAERTLQPAL